MPCTTTSGLPRLLWAPNNRRLTKMNEKNTYQTPDMEVLNLFGIDLLAASDNYGEEDWD